MEQQQDLLWFKDAIIYELHVKAFCDGNGDGIGDFPGLISKLDYLQELGVTALWLLPFYPSPGRDDGYDIADYNDVHPAFGVMADFHQFVDEAHRRGLRVITELVINHTSDQHPWFQAARKAPPGSPARDYYVWSDSDTTFDGTRIIFTDSEKSNWTWDEEAKAFYWHRFFYHQPDLNFDNPVVFNAVMDVMRFWFDAGVDGMRLDAVPYLCEREGTTNENLPETHAVIKRMRAELDRDYSDRMFLAEANQWPEDVREYFGNGDECHMAYHFPLMPRMYMAIAQEDRHPIVEIMEQTPDIPENCQWAVFLRNHDELTLEMVTDRERDYLYQTYASDMQARINLGIRRRLAPLLENDRQRIELMNLLLMTMPGSPILYYGDEIGMGDNFLLGDRNGVRTPMQWNGSLHGGFSVAADDKLFLPPIVDAQYGYGAVNVEAQHRNSYSLLNWMRRLITMRKAHIAFGRGTLRFLRPGNRKILAYLREHEGETMLCVANLSRTPQAVELDLSFFKTRVPVELLGRSKFPPIGELPYLLTLSGHGFYAFRLATDVEAPAWHEDRPITPDLPVLVLVETGWRTLFGRTEEGEGINQLMMRRAKEQLERNIIPRFFRAQPWFLDRGAIVQKFEFGDICEWNEGKGTWLLANIAVTLASGETHRYAIPLSLAWEDEDEHHVSALLHATLAKVRRRARIGILYDAFWDDSFCFAIVDSMQSGSKIKFGDGQLHFHSTQELSEVAQPMSAATVMRSVSERGRLVVNLNDQLVMKGYRWMLAGEHPELEVSRFLTEKTSFDHMPQLAGTVEYTDGAGQRSTLVILERYAHNQGNAWNYTLDYLERYLDECRANPEALPDATHAVYLELMKKLGLRTAQFHQALAQPDDEGAFGTEAISADDVRNWVNGVRMQMESVFDLLEKEYPQLPKLAQKIADQLLAVRPRLYRRMMRAAEVKLDGLKTRYHGDFHLGQVWLANNDCLITNFGGEPNQPWNERRRKHLALRDLADMLLSFSNAGATALDHVGGDSAEAITSLRTYVDDWETLAHRTFFRSYRREMSKHEIHPSNVAAAEVLTALFMMEKTLADAHRALSQHSNTVGVAIRRLIQVAKPRR